MQTYTSLSQILSFWVPVANHAFEWTLEKSDNVPAYKDVVVADGITYSRAMLTVDLEFIAQKMASLDQDDLYAFRQIVQIQLKAFLNGEDTDITLVDVLNLINAQKVS